MTTTEPAKTNTTPKAVTWSERYSVGVASIDTEHQKLIGMVNDLHAAMMQGKGKEVLGKIFDGLAAYTVSHFTREESLMRVHSYPGLERHKAEHDKLIAKVKELQAGYKSGQAAISMDVMAFLQHWLVDHIVGVDKAYSAHLKVAGVK